MHVEGKPEVIFLVVYHFVETHDEDMMLTNLDLNRVWTSGPPVSPESLFFIKGLYTLLSQILLRCE